MISVPEMLGFKSLELLRRKYYRLRSEVYDFQNSCILSVQLRVYTDLSFIKGSTKALIHLADWYIVPDISVDRNTDKDSALFVVNENSKINIALNADDGVALLELQGLLVLCWENLLAKLESKYEEVSS